jgi:hypothetical protein
MLRSAVRNGFTPGHACLIVAPRFTAACLRRRALLLQIAFTALALLSGCTIEIQAPPPMGYLAIVLKADAPPDVSPGEKYFVHIKEVSGTYAIDEQVAAAPNDTVLRLYPLAAYDISVDSVPEACSSRYGYAQRALISTAGNTTISRFNFTCTSLLAITVLADGYQVDSTFVWTATGPGASQFGRAHAADTVRLDHISGGAYAIELGHIAENCAVLSDGMRKQTIIIRPPSPGTVNFRLRCSDPAKSPRVLRFESSFHQDVSGFYAEVVDSDKDIAAYAWNVTDCLGNTLFRRAGVTRNQLQYDRTAGADTARIVGIVQIPDTTVDLSRACTALIFMDVLGNTTAWLEERNGLEAGLPPVITSFNVVSKADSLVTTLNATDPNNDLAGAFMSVYLRDGTLPGVPDGRPDIGIYSVVGYLPPFRIPSLRVNPGVFKLSDVLSVVVHVMDRAGNVTRAADTNLAQ